MAWCEYDGQENWQSPPLESHSHKPQDSQSLNSYDELHEFPDNSKVDQMSENFQPSVLLHVPNRPFPLLVQAIRPSAETLHVESRRTDIPIFMN